MKKLLLSLVFLSLTACTKSSDTSAGNAYRVDPLSLPAFKTHLQGILNNLQKQASERSPEASLETVNFVTYKTWFIAPIELETISKKTLGVSFNKDQTQQLAIQTATEIWIKRDLFEAMTLRDQANLIIHEFVMNLYFIKYKSISELCRLGSKKSVPNQCATYEMFDPVYPAQTPQPLNADDYQNIRRVTSFFMEFGETANKEQVRQVLEENNFDPRLFADRLDLKELNRTYEFPASDLAKMFQQNQISNRPIDKCSFLSLKQEIPCKMSYQETQEIDPHNKILMPHLRMTLKSVDDIQEFSSMSTMSHQFRKLWATKSFNPLKQSYYWVIPVDGYSMMNPKMGAHTSFNFLFAVEKNKSSGEPQLRINAWMKIPLEVVDIQRKPGENYGTCIYKRVEATSLQQDLLVASHDSRDVSYFQWWGENLPYKGLCQFSNK